MDQIVVLQQQVQQARSERQPLRIRGGGTRAFFGRVLSGQLLSLAEHRGIIRYEPSELVVTVRCGTPVNELVEVLAAQGQALPFDPPYFGRGSTVGGVIATGLAGPGRPWIGAVRDALLGVRCINGQGEVVQFGGEVVKNVAGFDLARLMVGAMGTLGVMLDVSIKLMPRPQSEKTCVFDDVGVKGLAKVNAWTSQGLPLSGAVLEGGRLYVRMSGTEAGVRAAVQAVGGQSLTEDVAAHWWRGIRDHGHDFFDDTRSLWRLSVPVTAPPINIIGDWLYDWGGSQRWLKTALQSTIIREMTGRVGGHAMLYRGGDRQGMVFHPLNPALSEVHRRIKNACDPFKLFNNGVLYPDI